MIILGQDHSRFNQSFPRLHKLDPSEWQVRAQAAIDEILVTLYLDFKTKYAINSTRKGADIKTLFKARLNSAKESKLAKDKFSSFSARGKDSRPPSLAQVSIRNCVTPGTLARIVILQFLGHCYHESNPESWFQVITYDPRPLLKLTPPSEASDHRVMTSNYIEAISKLPTLLSTNEANALLKRVSRRLHGRLQNVMYISQSL